jgi:hypothetical protein
MIHTADCMFLNQKIRLYTMVCTRNSCTLLYHIDAFTVQEMVNTQNKSRNTKYCLPLHLQMHPKYSNLRNVHLVYSVIYQDDGNECILTELILRDCTPGYL